MKQGRHEIKIPIHSLESFLLKQRLDQALDRDKSGINGCYRVRSLYFDNDYDFIAEEKLAGVEERKKFRLRFYDTDDSPYLLECKHKMNNMSFKSSIRLTREQTAALADGNIDILNEVQNPRAVWFLSELRGLCLKPKVVVDYERTAFVYEAGNVRITLDEDIRSGIYPDYFLQQSCTEFPVSEPNTGVLEIKYDTFLPQHIMHLVQIDNAYLSAHSKYLKSRAYS